MTACAPAALERWLLVGAAPTALWTSPTPRGLPRLRKEHAFLVVLLSLAVAAGVETGWVKGAGQAAVVGEDALRPEARERPHGSFTAR